MKLNRISIQGCLYLFDLNCVLWLVLKTRWLILAWLVIFSEHKVEIFSMFRNMLISTKKLWRSYSILPKINKTKMDSITLILLSTAGHFRLPRMSFHNWIIMYTRIHPLVFAQIMIQGLSQQNMSMLIRSTSKARHLRTHI